MNPSPPGSFGPFRSRMPRGGGGSRGGMRRPDNNPGAMHFTDQLASAVFVKDQRPSRLRSQPPVDQPPAPAALQRRDRPQRITGPTYSPPPHLGDRKPPQPSQVQPSSSARDHQREVRDEWSMVRKRRRSGDHPPHRRSYSPAQPSSVAMVPQRDRSPRYGGSPPRSHHVNQRQQYRPDQRPPPQRRSPPPPNRSPPPPHRSEFRPPQRPDRYESRPSRRRESEDPVPSRAAPPRNSEPTQEEVLIAEKVIAYGMEMARPPWLGVPCMVTPTFLVVSDGPLSRLVFDSDDSKQQRAGFPRDASRDSVDLTGAKPAGSRVHIYNDVELRALASNERFFRKLESVIGDSVPAHVYVLIGRNDVRDDLGLSPNALRDKILRFFYRLRDLLPGTDLTWVGVGALPLTSPHRAAALGLAKAMDGHAVERDRDRAPAPWLRCLDMCGQMIDDELLRGGDAWTRQYAHVFGTNLCHRMLKDLKEFRMKRIRHLFNFPGPKSSVGVGNVTVS